MFLIKKIYTAVKKIAIFIHPNLVKNWYSECTLKAKPNKIGRYYLDFIHELETKREFDENGIPLFPASKEFNLKYHPIYISHYALGVYEKLFRTNYKDEQLKKNFLNISDWFIANSKQFPHGIAWTIDCDYNEFNLKSGWISAMAQGEAISILTRAYYLTREEKYLEESYKVLWAFTKEVKEGGLINYFNESAVFEEYPTLKTNGALNGYIFALFGLYDLSILSENKEAKNLFELGSNSIAEILKYYDLGYWSQYWLYWYPKSYHASFAYHSLHIEQLKVLYYLTENEQFLKYSQKWESYRNNYFYRLKAVLRKILIEHE